MGLVFVQKPPLIYKKGLYNLLDSVHERNFECIKKLKLRPQLYARFLETFDGIPQSFYSVQELTRRQS